MSAFIILPPSPEPLMAFISIPFSAANFFASGDAFTLPLFEEVVVTTTV
jgi:hypothetical protein